MSRSFVFAVPGDLDTPTGGYAYDRRMIAELASLGWQADILDLGGEFPWPGPAARAAARARLAAVPPGQTIVIDGLALGVLPEVAGALGGTHTLIGLVHHPLALETGLSPEEAAALRASERAALSAVRHVVVTGGATARILAADYAVAADRITVARPGIDPVVRSRAPRAFSGKVDTGFPKENATSIESTALFGRSSCDSLVNLNEKRSSDGTVALLSVGALVPRKGYDVLLAALAQVADLPWRLTIAGARDRSPRTAAELDAAVAATKLGDRVTLAGAVSDDRLARLYAEADLFVLASRFEGYGMAFAQALAHGVPVIGTSAGAIPDTVPADAGLLVPPDDSAALAAALRRAIGNEAERDRLAAGARRAAERLPSWAASAQVFAQVLEALT